MEGFLNDFKNPKKHTTQIPFWFLNDVVDGDIWAKQIEEMAKKGVHQVMPHPRYGMDRREYLTEKYFKEFEKLLKKARQIGTIVHLYDEFNWASGPAGGRITEKRENLALGLNLKEVTLKAGESFIFDGLYDNFAGWGDFEEVIALKSYIPNVDSLNFDTMQDEPFIITDGEEKTVQITNKKSGSRKFCLFYSIRTVAPSPLKMGNGGIIDYLSEQPTKEFIAETHEKYYKHFKDYFGKEIVSIFYDESAPYSCGAFTISNSFFDDFKALKGYDLKQNLIYLFYDNEDVAKKVRCDYFEVLSELFAKNHIKPMDDWAKAHGISLTGHTFEETDRWNTGADPMYALRHQAWPGIDSLDGYKKYSELKSTAAISKLSGKDVYLCEALGCMKRWAASPANMISAYNQLAHLGVTHLVPHAFFQTVDNPKIECPPSFFDHNPYWKYYSKIADYTARLCTINQRFKTSCEVCVLFPIYSWWANGKGGRGLSYPWIASHEDSRTKEQRLSYHKLLDSLFSAHIDYDVIDSIALNEGNIKEKSLNINKESYKVVIVPFMSFIKKEDMTKLKMLSEAGVKVVFAQSCDDILNIVAELKENAVADVTSGVSEAVDITKKKGENVVIYTVSEKLGTKQSIELLIDKSKNTYILSPYDGCAYEADYKECGNKTLVSINLNPYEMVLIWAGENAFLQVKKLQSLKCTGDICLDKLMLNPQSELKVEYFKTFEMHNDENNTKIWKNWYKNQFDDSEWRKDTTTRGKKLYSHTGSQLIRMSIPAGAVGIKLPLPIEKEFALYINGERRLVVLDKNPPQSGVIEIEKSSKGGLLAIECSSMAPDFGLTDGITFVMEKTDAYIGDMCEAGYDFYSGFVKFEQTIDITIPKDVKSAKLELFKACECAEVFINGKNAGYRLFAPYTFEISELLVNGENKIEIIVSNLLANRYAYDSYGSRGRGRLMPWGLFEKPIITFYK